MRWFNRLYLRVTEQVTEYVNTVPQAAPGFLERLDIIFANAYFAALGAAEPAGSELPRGYEYHAWKPLFARRYARDVAPIQFALATPISTMTWRWAYNRYAPSVGSAPTATPPNTMTRPR